jgi:hypothetical protein
VAHRLTRNSITEEMRLELGGLVGQGSGSPWQDVLPGSTAEALSSGADMGARRRRHRPGLEPAGWPTRRRLSRSRRLGLVVLARHVGQESLTSDHSIDRRSESVQLRGEEWQQKPVCEGLRPASSWWCC